MKIAHDPNDPVRFTFPSGTRMNPGQYLVLSADSRTSLPGLHLGFALAAAGDGVFLYDRNGKLVDSVRFGPQLPDLSLGRVGYDDSWRLMVPTLGQANVRYACGDPDDLKINEWLAKPKSLSAEGFIEVYNPQDYPVDLGGMRLTQSPVLGPPMYQLPSLSFIPGAGYAVVWTGPSASPWHWNTVLPSSGGTIALWDSDANQVDALIYGPQTADVSQGRTPDGGSLVEPMATPTPGAANLSRKMSASQMEDDR
jgi:hypothetical protein